MDAIVPTTQQFATLKNVLAKWDKAKLALEDAQREEEALHQEAFALARVIYKHHIIDDNYELAPTFCEGKTIEKVDSAVIRRNHPDIYERCRPHVDNHGMAAILKSIHEEGELQSMLRSINEELWLERSSITKADLKKHTNKSEWQMLEEEGAIVTDVKFDGEIKLVCKAFQKAIDSQHEFHKEIEEAD